MRIAICDDNMSFASQVENVILSQNLSDIETEVFSSGKELLSHIEEGYTAQIYFLDIEMPGIDGIRTAQGIREKDTDALLIYMTQHHEYVYSVFETLPFRFLRKPFSDELVQKTFLECLEHLDLTEKYYFFKADRIQRQLPYSEILYFEGSGRKVILHGTKESYEFYERISHVAEVVDDTAFCRVHVSFIINMDAIRSIRETEVLLKDGTILPISKTYRQEAKEKHMQYMLKKNGGNF